MSEPQVDPENIAGERDASLVTRALSVQSRVSNLLAIGLMSVLGLGSLAWYYANAISRQGSARQTAQAAAVSRAQGDMPLPSLGRIDAPNLPPPEPSWQQSAGPPLAEIPLTPSPLAATPAASTAPPVKSAAELAQERALSGAVFSGSSTVTAITAASTADGVSGAYGATDVPAAGDLGARLHASQIPAVTARILPTQRLLLPKGAFIDCTLETAIDSTLPGMTTCVMATDAFSVDGSVVLLERGTKLIGETRGQVQQGSARIFVLWSEARTPRGVIVPLLSPGADELGRAGLPGEANRHFWDRFGAALLVSVVDGAIAAASQSSRGGGTVILNPSGSQDVLTEILKNTVSIAPTVVKPNGDRIAVLVARDIDFRAVYELRSVADR